MGHSIHAAIVKAEIGAEAAEELGLKRISLAQGLTMIPLSDSWCDDWAAKLEMPGFVAEVPLLNARIVHRALAQLAPGCPFALIETDYFGGIGTQSAAVYRDGAVLMAPESGEVGPINAALELLGVTTEGGLDEFDTVGLQHWRHLDDLE